MIEATALYEDVLGHVPIGTINSAWFQFIMHPRFTPSTPLSKRILDLVVSSIMVAAGGAADGARGDRGQARGSRAGVLPPAPRG